MPDLSIALRQIREAPTSEAVLNVVRRFLLDLSIIERGELPWGLTPELLAMPTDVALWSLQLNQNHGEGQAGPAYGRVAKVIAEATIRIAQLGTVLA